MIAADTRTMNVLREQVSTRFELRANLVNVVTQDSTPKARTSRARIARESIGSLVALVKFTG